MQYSYISARTERLYIAIFIYKLIALRINNKHMHAMIRLIEQGQTYVSVTKTCRERHCMG